MSEIQAIRDLITQAKLEEAAKRMEALDSSYQDEIRGIQTNITTLKRDQRQGILDQKDINLNQNKIIVGLLSILSDIEKEQASSQGNTLTPQENTSSPETDSSDKKPDLNIPEQYQKGLEKVFLKNSLKSILWLREGDEKSKSVCKIHVSDGSVGSGFLVNGGFIFTNNHVIESTALAQFSEVEFGYDTPDAKTVRYKLDHNQLYTSKELDYTKVKVIEEADKPPLSEWGKLEISTITPREEDVLVIIQHPDGRPKEIAFSDGGISIEAQNQLAYYVSTEGGSSGSPVFDINWRVVALHNGWDRFRKQDQPEKRNHKNTGTLFQYILEDLVSKEPEASHKKESYDSSNNKVEKPVKAIMVYNKTDQEYAEGISRHLIMQVRQKKLIITDIHDTTTAGLDTIEANKKALAEASLVFFLISNHLYKPDTLKLALQVEELVSEKRVIPIKVSPFDWEGTSFENLKGLPFDDSAINESENLDQTLYEIGQQIIKVIDEISYP